MTDEKKPSKTTQLDLDYRRGAVPEWVKEVIETHLAIEAEDAKSAGSLGFMARALVTATMPYKDPKADVFKRVNGDFSLRIVAGYEGGIPYGIYPRLLMSWVATEAVRTRSPVIELGDSLSMFLRDVLEIQRGGGKRGTSTRVAEQMKRLFGSLITAQYTGGNQGRGFQLRNVMIADGMDFDERDLKLDGQAAEMRDGYKEYLDSLTQKETHGSIIEAKMRAEMAPAPAADEHHTQLWIPQEKEQAGAWKSSVTLSRAFYEECINKPVPIDLRAYKALRGSPLAMDVYVWLTYRMSYTDRRSRPIRWESLMAQFGSNYTTDRAVLDFKKAFLKALKLVLLIYPNANIELAENGLILLPSQPHVAKQGLLF